MSGAKPPLVYSCSGCSSAAQMANDVAVRLNAEGHAQMSCIAGVGGDVPSLVKIAKSKRPMVVIDGCKLSCAAACLRRHGVVADVHHNLADHGVPKRTGPYDQAQMEEVYERVLADLPAPAEPGTVDARPIVHAHGVQP